MKTEMNQELIDDIIDDYRNIVMVNNADHMIISDDEILSLWNGVDMVKEMRLVESQMRDNLNANGHYYLAKKYNCERMQDWVRESVWQKYSENKLLDSGLRFVFKKRPHNKIKFVKFLSEESVLSTFLEEVMTLEKYTEIGCNDEGIFYITLDSEVIGGVMCEVTENRVINIRLVPDETKYNKDYEIKALDSFGLYDFCEKVYKSQR